MNFLKLTHADAEDYADLQTTAFLILCSKDPVRRSFCVIISPILSLLLSRETNSDLLLAR